MRIILSGLEYLSDSPSTFQLVVSAGHEPLWLGCGGPGAWFIGSSTQWGSRAFSSRHEAAEFVRAHFDQVARDAVC